MKVKNFKIMVYNVILYWFVHVVTFVLICNELFDIITTIFKKIVIIRKRKGNKPLLTLLVQPIMPTQQSLASGLEDLWFYHKIKNTFFFQSFLTVYITDELYPLKLHYDVDLALAHSIMTEESSEFLHSEHSNGITYYDYTENCFLK